MTITHIIASLAIGALIVCAVIEEKAFDTCDNVTTVSRNTCLAAHGIR